MTVPCLLSCSYLCLTFGLEALWHGTAEFHDLSRPRVYEGQTTGMKGEASERVCLRPVLPVSGNRVTYPLRVDAYLISTPGLEVELNFSVWLSFDR